MWSLRFPCKGLAWAFGPSIGRLRVLRCVRAEVHRGLTEFRLVFRVWVARCASSVHPLVAKRRRVCRVFPADTGDGRGLVYLLHSATCPSQLGFGRASDVAGSSQRTCPWVYATYAAAQKGDANRHWIRLLRRAGVDHAARKGAHFGPTGRCWGYSQTPPTLKTVPS